jgi:Abnormal spindle-like microcephaly-assoc'd, ASPM-SPD-2-Hydin
MKSPADVPQVAHPESDTHKERAPLSTLPLVLLSLPLALATLVVSGCVGLGGQASPGAGPLSPSASAVDFGSVALGRQATQIVDLTNNGTEAVNISHVTVTGTGFTLVGKAPSGSLAAGQSATMQIRFAPAAAGEATGGFSVSSNAKNSLMQGSLTGKGAAAGTSVLTANPGSIGFGIVNVGNTATQSVTITNAGSGSLTITTVSADGAGFSASGITLPYSLAAGSTTSFAAAFAPARGGDATGSISIAASSGDSSASATVALSGTGAQAAISASPSLVSFGTVAVGQTSSQTVTISNPGSASLTISRATVSGSGFSPSGLATPLTILPGQSSSFSVAFKPGTASSFSGAVSLASNAPRSPLTIGLSGTGGTATQVAITASPSSVSFGTVNVGSSAAQTVTLRNSGTTSESVTTVSASGTGFAVTGITLPYTLAAGSSTTFTARFAPTAADSAAGSVSIAATGDNSTANATVALGGTGAQPGISANPSNVAFGTVVIGQSHSQPITISNSGNVSLTISRMSVSGTGFSASPLATPLTIGPGQSSSLNVAFGPTSASTSSGSISLTSNAPNSPLTIPLSGTGASAMYALSLTPSSLSFGSVTLNTTTSRTVSLENTGNSNITISAVSLSGAGFSDSGVNSGVILASGQSTTLTVRFDPSTAGSVTGAVSITSNAANSPQSVPLSGTGATSHTVALSWTPSTTSTVIGYNVYRGTVSGTYSRINASAVGGTSYSDSTVQSGENITYYYVVTAVDSSGVESTVSNQATALVP